MGAATDARVVPLTVNAGIDKLYGDDGRVLAIAAPVRNGFGKAEAVWVNCCGIEAFDDALARVHDSLAAAGMPSARLMVLDKTGVVLTGRGGRGEGNRDEALATELARQSASDGFIEGPAGTKRAYARIAGLDWTVITEVPEAELHRTLTGARGLLLIVAGVVLVVVCVSGAVAGTRMASPIRRLTMVMDRLAQSELATDVEGGGRSDKIGGMARAVEVFKRNAQEVRRLTGEQKSLKDEAERTRQELLTSLADHFERQFVGLLASVCDVAQTAQATDQITRSIDAIQLATVHAVGNIQRIAAMAKDIVLSIADAIEQQSTATGKISRNAMQAAAGARTVAGSIDSVAKNVLIADHSASAVLEANHLVTHSFLALEHEVRQFSETVRRA